MLAALKRGLACLERSVGAEHRTMRQLVQHRARDFSTTRAVAVPRRVAATRRSIDPRGRTRSPTAGLRRLRS
eukprot:1705811-Rhodomonas_salina.1